MKRPDWSHTYGFLLHETDTQSLYHLNSQQSRYGMYIAAFVQENLQNLCPKLFE